VAFLRLFDIEFDLGIFFEICTANVLHVEEHVLVRVPVSMKP
jgi:hypothetical protein